MTAEEELARAVSKNMRWYLGSLPILCATRLTEGWLAVHRNPKNNQYAVHTWSHRGRIETDDWFLDTEEALAFYMAQCAKLTGGAAGCKNPV